ncbi:MAG: nucleotidyltransferase family protein [Nitrospinae bacterium]|nr:nucleotidyltransferase family protein [Nitrospinota bacterium]MBI3814878.1 nucleotidyltransferase family protein [Nitrospinota bacterium]
MKAMILAAGYGERMKPLTDKIPKPLLPLDNKPILHYTLKLLKKNGIKEIVINLHHLHQMVIDAFGDGSSYGMKIHYSYEKEILGTAGGIKAAEKFLRDGTFLVINSDIITNIDINKVLEFHRGKKAVITMVLREDADADRYGAIEIDSTGRVRKFLGITKRDEGRGTRDEGRGQPLKKLMFTGIHIFEPDIFNEIPPGRYCGITEEIYPKLINSNAHVYGYEFNGYWIDIGTHERYEKAKRDVFNNHVF